jgi:general secretion pathway protein M
MAWYPLLKARWAALGAREQRALRLASAVVLAALLWLVLLAPALRTLKSAEAQNLQLSTELEHMQALQLRAKTLRATPALSAQETLLALQSASNALGKSAELQVVGEQATLRFKQLSTEALAQWLRPPPESGQSPAEAQLQRDAATALWSGSMVFQLPTAR